MMREMVEVDVCDLEGSALDYAVARAVGHDVTFGQWGPIHYGAIVTQPVDIAPEQTVPFRPSTDWSQGGPLIEECITSAEKYSGEEPWYTWPMPVGIGSCCGRTLLIASMRAIVMSEIGDPVQVPKELMG
ncbi:uncharacterized protein DUF2591 [Kushneria sinocarnis]|uniref:Uncharacterized protein DUF2591 n=1 Tax=Kushneria sinocarnis TaxID=595502 RepID=A0A420WUH4_9GAMM|nr:uncharacterized protein DUF2591 [Kushneria sinocarnis]